MPLKNFRSYDLAVELYRKCKGIPLPSYAKDQLLRASMSICLNLAERKDNASTPSPSPA